MEYRVVDSIEPIAPEWDDLATRTGASPFLRPGWFQAWWNAFGRGRLQILVAYRDGSLAGVAPVHRRRRTDWGISNVHSPLFDFVAEDAAARRGLVERFYAAKPPHTALWYLDADAPGTQELERSASAAGRRVLTLPTHRAPYVETTGTWEAFERGLPSKFTRDLRRRRRLLEGEGEVAVEFVDGPEQLEDVFRVEPSGWKEQRGTSIASDPSTDRFYREVAAWAAERGILRLAFLRLDGRALAAQYALEDGRWYFLKGGVDPEAKRFAPGKLLVHAGIERAFAAGLESFEFLGADEPWKNDWLPRHREVVVQHTFRRTPIGLGRSSAVAAWRLVGLPLAKRTLGWAR